MSSSSTRQTVGRLYLAGPFTSKTVRPGTSGNTMDMISGSSEWRWALLAAERTLVDAGWSVFLPHRDVSQWGARCIAPGDVVRECLAAVAESDLVIALLEESFGTHVEVGVALGKGIPVVIVRCQDETQSYFGGGIGPSSLAGELVIPTMRSLADYLHGTAFDEALHKARVAAESLASLAG